MIQFTHGDIFAQATDAIVNPVNCVGVMGRGLALQFKRRHPAAFLAYRRACEAGRVRPGRMFMFDTGCDRPRWIAHFPTKRHWRDRSAIGDIEAGLRDLAAAVARHGIRSIAIPPLGCGLGGLDWRAVRPLVSRLPRRHSGHGHRSRASARPLTAAAARPEPPPAGRQGSRYARRPPSRRRREPERGRDRAFPRQPRARCPHALRVHPSSRLRRCRHARRTRAMNATAVAAALGTRAEEVCRRYLPHGRKHGRYWTAGDIRGAQGRSLFVRLAPPGVPGKWTDAATGEHGDLLDLIRIASGAGSLRIALAEARAFLAMPAMPLPTDTDSYDRTDAARRLWQRCRAIDGTHAEAYLRARAIDRCRFPALRFHPALFHRDGGGVRRLPALVAAVTGADDTLTGVHRTWLDPKLPAKAPVARPRKALGRIHGLAVRFGDPAPPTLLVGEGIETVLSLVAALPDTVAAAALSAGSLGAFAPPPGVSRLVVARDNDPDGERAAERLARRCASARVDVQVLVPEGDDFNDDLLALGSAALAARLAPLLRYAEGRGQHEWA